MTTQQTETIQTLINQAIQNDDLSASAVIKGDCLQVTVSGESAPSKDSVTQDVLTVLKNTSIKSLKTVRIYGRTNKSLKSLWVSECPIPAKVDKTDIPLYRHPWFIPAMLINMAVGILLLAALASVFNREPVRVSQSPPSAPSLPSPRPTEESVRTQVESEEENAAREFREMSLNVAALNAEFAIYKSLKENFQPGMDITKVFERALMDAEAVLQKHPASIRDEAREEAASQALKTVKMANTEPVDVDAVVNRIQERHRKAVADYGILITVTID